MLILLQSYLLGTEQNLMKVDFQINPVDVNAYYFVKVLTQPLDVFFHKVKKYFTFIKVKIQLHKNK